MGTSHRIHLLPTPDPSRAQGTALTSSAAQLEGLWLVRHVDRDVSRNRFAIRNVGHECGNSIEKSPVDHVGSYEAPP
jgi:hypothetical protein